MSELLERTLEAFRDGAAWSAWESAAVALAIAYLLLAMRRSLWCWAAALVSTSIYLAIFVRAGLYMEAALQAFYIAMAIYGWYAWRYGGDRSNELPISTWPGRAHVLAIAATLAAAAASGWALSTWTDARLPYLDSFTTWSSLIATWMVARKVLENWVYWFVIDSASIVLYVKRELYQTAALFALYVVLVVFGYLSWKRALARQAEVAA